MPILSNPRHERFAQELAKGKSATEASDVSGVQLRPAINLIGAYVYLLVDPRNGDVFYIGKGTRNRVSTHWRAMLAGHIHNAAKHERLRAIYQSGQRVIELCLMDGMSDEAALLLERAMIGRVGYARLTNALAGTQSVTARELVHCLDMISRVRPYRAWKAMFRPSDADCRLYLRVWRELHRVRRALESKFAVA